MPDAAFFGRWQLLTAAMRELDDCGALDDVLEVLRHRARAIARCDGVTVIAREGDEVAYVGEDAIAPLWTGKRFAMRTCISGIAMVERRAIVIADVRADDRVPLSAYLATFVQSMAMFPIGAGEPIAALGCYWAQVAPIEPSAIRLIETLTSAANASLERLAAQAERPAA